MRLRSGKTLPGESLNQSSRMNQTNDSNQSAAKPNEVVHHRVATTNLHTRLYRGEREGLLAFFQDVEAYTRVQETSNTPSDAGLLRNADAFLDKNPEGEAFKWSQVSEIREAKSWDDYKAAWMNVRKVSTPKDVVPLLSDFMVQTTQNLHSSLEPSSLIMSTDRKINELKRLIKASPWMAGDGSDTVDNIAKLLGFASIWTSLPAATKVRMTDKVALTPGTGITSLVASIEEHGGFQDQELRVAPIRTGDKADGGGKERNKKLKPCKLCKETGHIFFKCPLYRKTDKRDKTGGAGKSDSSTRTGDQPKTTGAASVPQQVTQTMTEGATGMFCRLHNSTSHNLESCHLIGKFIKKHKEQWENSPSGQGQSNTNNPNNSA